MDDIIEVEILEYEYYQAYAEHKTVYQANIHTGKVLYYSRRQQKWLPAAYTYKGHKSVSNSVNFRQITKITAKNIVQKQRNKTTNSN